MRCAMFKLYANILVIHQNINIFTQETLYPSFISKKKNNKKNWRSPEQTVIKTSTFYHIFTFINSA